MKIRQSRVGRLAAGSARRGRITLGVWLALILAGLAAWFGGLDREGFPPVNLPLAVVDGVYFVDDAEQVDADVTSRLQSAYSDIDGVEEVQTFARANSYAAVVEFDDSLSSPEGAALLEAVSPQLALPEQATITVRSLDATKFVDVFDILVSVSGPTGTTPEELEAAAETLATHLETADAISVAEVRNLLTEAEAADGTIETRTTRFTRVAFADSDGFKDGIAIGLVRNSDAGLDVLSFSDAVSGALADAPSLGEGFRADITADFADDIENQLGSLTGNLFTGLLAVALVSLALIGWRVAVLTATFMATVVLSALVGLWAVGYSLNTITLFGLILTLGLLVDDAIVISESIDAHRDDDVGGSTDDLIGHAVGQVGTASLSGTITTVLVFTPLLFISGVLGGFIRPIPATVIITLLMSFVLSVTVLPAMARRFLLPAPAANHWFIRVQRRAAAGLGRFVGRQSGNGWRGWMTGGAAVAFAALVVFASLNIASGLGFTIFPPTRDSNGIQLTADFDAGTTIEEAQQIADEVDEIVIDTLGDTLVRSQYVRGNERVLFLVVDLTPFGDRGPTSPDLADALDERLAAVDGARISARPFETGPRVDDFPFAVQIDVGDDADSIAAGNQLAVDIGSELRGLTLDKTGNKQVTITDTVVSSAGSVVRTNGQRSIEVRASFDDDEATANLDAAESYVIETWSAELESRGLSADALDFDFGQESDNQDDFAGLMVALLVAVALMLLLLIVQFRSLVQPLLIFMAVPFSFFGVFALLSVSGNPLSFFVMVGFIALMGVVVNNTILLIDAANQHRRSGATPGDSIARAVTQRARPLVATTVTTVVGLLPLALSDPFWEALSLVLIGGLASSTVLVLVAFPTIYLAVETIRGSLRRATKRGSLAR